MILPMCLYTLYKDLVGIYVEDRAVTVLPTGDVVEVWTGAIPLVGIIQVRHNGRMMRMFAHDLRDSARLDDATREGRD
jgi:hypothetical protein